MHFGIALAKEKAIPLLERILPKAREMFEVHDEAWFFFREGHAVIPVLFEDRIDLVRWGPPEGSRRRQTCYLCPQATAAMSIAEWQTDRVIIPADRFYTDGQWHDADGGLYGLLVTDATNGIFAYVIGHAGNGILFPQVVGQGRSLLGANRIPSKLLARIAEGGAT